MKTILAIDLGKSKSVFCKMDTTELKPRFSTLKTSPQKFHDVFAELDQQNSIVLFEVGAQSGWLSDMLRLLGIDFKTANVNHPSWKWSNNPNKSDKNDAHRLAMMYQCSNFPEVYVPLKEVRQKRSLIYYRQKLVNRSTQIKNSIRALATTVAVDLPSGKECWTQKHRKQLQHLARPLHEIDDPCQLWKGQLFTELQQLDMLQDNLKAVDSKLDKLNSQLEPVTLLQTVPGVGPRTAEALVAIIDDPNRFKSCRQICSYVGFTPKRFQSGNIDRSGRISKRGNPQLRMLLVQASWAALRFSWAREIYERVRRGSRNRKKTAIIAVARHMLMRCWAMLRDNKSWQYKIATGTVKP